MKVSAAQLDMVLSRLKNTINGYARSSEDLVVDVEFATADPGSGQMVDTITLTATSVVTDSEETKETKMVIEVYPELEKQEPRATKTETFIVKKKY